MKVKQYRYHMADFETTVFEGQKHTEVWAAATVELYTEDVFIFHSIDELFDYYAKLHGNHIVYFHNLKFDGSFWLDFLLRKKVYKQAYQKTHGEPFACEWLPEKEMCNNTFKYSISDRGQWYSIVIKVNNKFIEIRDSLKLLPFSVERIGKSFRTKHKKLNMEYKGFRYAGCIITDKEKEYIANDVLVVKEALEIMFNEKHKKLTIGSCCLQEFKNGYDKIDYANFFPNLYEIGLNQLTHKYRTAGDFILKSYRGGWCYYVKGKEGKVFHKGLTADVNSLYPSVMHSESGNKYPVGKPKFWNGNYIPDEALGDNKYYFVRIKTRFYLRPGYLPFIQLKGNFLYKGTESLETSDVRNPDNGNYYPYYIGKDGEVCDTRVEMVVTMTDYQLIKEHYELVDFEIIDGCWFYAEIGLFDTYINKYRDIKVTAKGARRELAKLFLNNLYGKMASSTNSSFKVAYLKEDGSIGFVQVTEHNKEPGYIPIGSAITSYAREFTIRAAQKNYYGPDKPGFAYADTDSIHCNDISSEDLIGVPVHNTAFCHWKVESIWDMAIFTRQKTYVEHVTEADVSRETSGVWVGEKTDWWNVKCAGMSEKSKRIFVEAMNPFPKRKDVLMDMGYTEEQANYILTGKSIEEFCVGMEIPDGKLLPKRIKGGIVLVEGPYHMR